MIFGKKVEEIFRRTLYVRHDETGLTYYFSYDEFPGLKQTPYDVESPLGHTLKGYIYTYGNHDPNRLIIFDHGMGVGHRAYMQEIVLLCKQGYRVFTYDHTGCATSGGEHIHGFAQSLADLDVCLQALKADPQFAGVKYAVMGHSWGGFSTMNIVKYHPDITHVVAMSGFISVEQIIRQTFSGILSLYRKQILRLEQEGKGSYALDDARESLGTTTARVLLIHSSDDPVVKSAYHFDLLERALKEKDNITFLRVEGKQHSPNDTLDAVAYKDAYFKTLGQVTKKRQFADEAARHAFRDSYDWQRMTEQDMDVWEQIFAHLATM